MSGASPAAGNRSEKSPGALRLFAVPDFRRLWIAGFTVFVVRWLEILAVGVFVYQRTGSAFLVALLSMLRPLAMVTLGAFIGEFADRLERRTVLLLVVTSLFVTALAMLAVAFAEVLEIWHLILAACVTGVAGSSDIPVRRLMLGNAVSPERLSQAMSLDVGSHNASRMVGPLLAGMVLAQAGITGVFAVSASLYLIAVVAVLRVRQRKAIAPAPAPKAASPLSDLIARIQDGLAIARRDPNLFGTLVVTMIYNIWAWPFISMIPVLGHDNWNLTADAVGYLASMDGIGAFSGAVVVAIVVRPSLYRLLYVGGTAMFMVMAIVFALAPSAIISGAALLILGFCGAGFSIMQATLAYLSAPVEMRGRILGVLTVCIGIGVIGYVHLGFMADLIGAKMATVVMCVEGLLALALTRRYWRVVG